MLRQAPLRLLGPLGSRRPGHATARPPKRAGDADTLGARASLVLRPSPPLRLAQQQRTLRPAPRSGPRLSRLLTWSHSFVFVFRDTV